jgi:hypothetical protein
MGKIKKSGALYWRVWMIELDHNGGPALVAPFHHNFSRVVTKARTPRARCSFKVLETEWGGGGVAARLGAAFHGVTPHTGPAPAKHCGCGWHAVASPEALSNEAEECGLTRTARIYRDSFNPATPHLIALTPVHPLGRTLPGHRSHGLRAERLQLLAIHLSPHAWSTPGLADQLAARFDLPVSPIPGTERIKRWRPPWGWDGVSPW